jgi:hypothetical protein
MIRTQETHFDVSLTFIYSTWLWKSFQCLVLMRGECQAYSELYFLYSSFHKWKWSRVSLKTDSMKNGTAASDFPLLTNALKSVASWTRGPHSSDYLLSCEVTYVGRGSPQFRRNELPPSSGSKSRQAINKQVFCWRVSSSGIWRISLSSVPPLMSQLVHSYPVLPARPVLAFPSPSPDRHTAHFRAQHSDAVPRLLIHITWLPFSGHALRSCLPIGPMV